MFSFGEIYLTWIVAISLIASIIGIKIIAGD
jgi:hypothetical protein